MMTFQYPEVISAERFDAMRARSKADRTLAKAAVVRNAAAARLASAKQVDDLGARLQAALQETLKLFTAEGVSLTQFMDAARRATELQHYQ